MKPICVPCQRFYRCIKNDFAFIEAMPAHDGGVAEAVPGNSYPDHWAPYKLWYGDKWRCEGCGSEIVVGCAQRPFAEHYQPNFAKVVDSVKPQLQVNDC